MIKKLILTISMFLPSLLLASSEKKLNIIEIESASESESTVALGILSKYAGNLNTNMDLSGNLTVHFYESQKKAENLILKLRNSLGGSVKIEQLSANEMKMGTQDHGGWGK